jgi:Tfp pilus assembly PilM family ATPase
MEYLFSEIGSVLQSYEQEYRKALTKIYLVGGGSQLLGFKEELQTRFAIPVSHSDAFSKAQAPVFLEQVLVDAGPAFAVALGCALKELQ